MLKYKLTLLSCLIIIIQSKSLKAQSVADSSAYKLSVTNLINHFDQNIGEASVLYNGFKYTGYAAYIKGSPYLGESSTWKNGSLTYDGSSFNNVPMLYDLNADQLIVLLGGNAAKAYRLVSDKVVSFTIQRQVFVRIIGNDNGFRTGFYEQLYGGKSQVVNKLAKTIKTTFSNGASESDFIAVKDLQDYYIKKGSTYYSINSLGDVLDIFKDKKKALQQYIRSNNLNYNAFKEISLIKIATYYDHLTE
jgi:hypothetical protein